MSDSTARTVTTLGIWASFGWALASAFKVGWNGNPALVLNGIVVALICGSAVAGTAFVWRGASSRAALPAKPTPTPDEEWARS